MKYLIICMTLGLFLVGCETTLGSKRSNGSATEHTTAKLKNVTVEGDLIIGGATQTSHKAEQEGLGKIKGEAVIKDSVNGNKVPQIP